MYDLRPLVTYAHAQLKSLYPLSTLNTYHVTKNTRLSTLAQLQRSHSGAWEPWRR